MAAKGSAPIPTRQRARAASAFLPDVPPGCSGAHNTPFSRHGEKGLPGVEAARGVNLNTGFSTPFRGLGPPKTRHATLNTGLHGEARLPGPPFPPQLPSREWATADGVPELPLKSGALQPSGEPPLTANPLISGFPESSVGKESACNERDPGSIPGWGRSPGGGNGNPFQHSCLNKPVNRGAWWDAAPGVAEGWTQVRTERPRLVLRRVAAFSNPRATASCKDVSIKDAL